MLAGGQKWSLAMLKTASPKINYAQCAEKAYEASLAVGHATDFLGVWVDAERTCRATQGTVTTVLMWDSPLDEAIKLRERRLAA